MKKYVYAVNIALILGLFSSCGLLTLHPIFTVNDLSFDARLLGKWKAGKDGTIMQYTRAEKNDLGELPGEIKMHADKVYMLTMKKEGEKEARYYVFLVKLGPNYYFDYYPADVDRTGKIDDFYKAHYTRLHAISRVNIVSNASIRISEFDDSYMNKLIDTKNIRIKREKEGNLITASTAELKQYILKYGDVNEAYGGQTVDYTRIP